jgi:hypothetical protein
VTPPVTLPRAQVKVLAREAVRDILGLTPLQVVAMDPVVTVGKAWLTEVSVPNDNTSFVIPAMDAFPGLAAVRTIFTGPVAAFIPLT